MLVKMKKIRCGLAAIIGNDKDLIKKAQDLYINDCTLVMSDSDSSCDSHEHKKEEYDPREQYKCNHFLDFMDNNQWMKKWGQGNIEFNKMTMKDALNVRLKQMVGQAKAGDEV